METKHNDRKKEQKKKIKGDIKPPRIRRACASLCAACIIGGWLVAWDVIRGCVFFYTVFCNAKII
jgi:hypothetical protein